ncbi:hypothetical protein RI543_003861 [Arxiozyma heterogenica]|uniref:Uncharacterized protein n=1 Tax=Arxiozyma heterogenica TaxID=278026 RepID=A0AAN7WSE6_9SACH|nr:hypothetical protein RI543_003861 [Kazachstania heterogenica]
MEMTTVYLLEECIPRKAELDPNNPIIGPNNNLIASNNRALTGNPKIRNLRVMSNIEAKNSEQLKLWAQGFRINQLYDFTNEPLSTDDRIINNSNISTTSLNDILKMIDSTDT